jgi:hypothetical protein
MYAPILSHLRATCLAYLLLLCLITRTIWGDKAWNSSLSSLLHSSVTSSVLDPNTFLSILFSNHLSLPSFLSTTKFPSHTKLQAKLYFCIS